MTDVRERVARAIWQAEQPGRNWEAFQSWNDAETAAENKRVFGHADAALLACGYAEMRKALELVVHEVGWHGNGEKDSEQFYCEHCDQTNENYTMIAHKPECIVAVARSILERTGEK